MRMITTDFQKGDTMIVMRDNSFTVETFSGNYHVNASMVFRSFLTEPEILKRGIRAWRR